MLAAVFGVTQAPRRLETRRQVLKQTSFVGERLARRIVPPGRRPRVAGSTFKITDHPRASPPTRAEPETKNTQSLAIPRQDRRPTNRQARPRRPARPTIGRGRRIKLHEVDAPCVWRLNRLLRR